MSSQRTSISKKPKQEKEGIFLIGPGECCIQEDLFHFQNYKLVKGSFAYFTLTLNDSMMSSHHSQRVWNAVFGWNLKNDRRISVCFQGKPCNITVIQVYAPTSNVEEAEVEQFYEDLQDLLELTPKKDVLFLIGDWNAKVGSQETPGVTGKFGLGIQNEAGQRLIVLPRKCTGHSKHPLPTTQEKTLHMDITRWSTLKSD